ncbi:MAG: nitrogenase iron protein, partial [Methanomicrobium sp.]|nr:nitrogenase iron protein [Methanomicrobium sp.]
EKINSELTGFIPRSQIVRVAEVNKKTVIEYAPESEQADVYRKLADKIMNTNPDPDKKPTPLSMDDLETLAQKYIKA